MDMNPRVAKYLRVFQELVAKEPDLNGALAELKSQGATWAISFRVLQEAGYEDDASENLLDASVWKGFSRSFEDLFYDFLELDNDLSD